MTHDLEFERWASRAWRFDSLLEMQFSVDDLRTDLVVELHDEAGQLAIAYRIARCWVSEFQALPDLDANANALAIARIKLENEGWEQIPDKVE